MFGFIERFLIKSNNYDEPIVREKCGVVCSGIGIGCNVLLFALKLMVGMLVGSVAIMSDAFNNLADMGSTAVSLIGIKLSNRKPDREHPFGHGRLEYIAALIVSFIILSVGFELAKTSVDKIIHPQESNFALIPVLLLLISLPIKLFMFAYNRFFGKKIKSSVLSAASRDSINDCLATGAVIASAIVDSVTNLNVDGYMGVIVSLLIMYTGYGIAKDTIGLLLGQAPSAELVRSISEIMESSDDIEGIHDLIVHNYGPGRVFASVHAEIPDDADIVKAHEHIDALEHRVFHELGCELVVHMDPISVNSSRVNEMKRLVKEILNEIDGRMTVHDFRMTDGAEIINLIFDIVIPYEISNKQQVLDTLNAELKKRDSRINTVIQVDNDYSGVSKEK